MRILIRLFFRTLRLVLTPFVLLWSALPGGRRIERDPEAQAEVDAQTSTLALYQFRTCPFCIRVRRAIRRLALDIELRDAQFDPDAREQLLNGGGQVQVPCLRITETDGTVRWLYESDAIVEYLEQRFGEQPVTAAG